jgi:hypothetical protein
MNVVFALVIALLGFTSLPALAQSGRTFYIDYSSGSNSNPGTKAAPWKTHPYMQASAACTGSGSAPSYSHAAGDHFIFKGSVTWPAPCFQIAIQASGTSGAQDYYGVDSSWPSSGWVRPKFELSQQVPTGGHVIYGSSHTYITIDNIEIADQAIAAGCGFGGCDAIQFYGSNGSVVLENLYIHDFMTTGKVSSSWGPDYSAGGVLGWVHLLGTTIDDSNGFGFNASGAKVTGGMMGGGCQNCAEVGKSKFVATMAACFSSGSCHDNEFTGIAQSVFDSSGSAGYAPMGSMRPHTQIIEDDSEGIGPCGGAQIYNNWIHDNSAGVTLLVCYNDVVYNNVLTNNSNTYILLGPPNPDHASNVGSFYNNTVDCGSTGSACWGGGSTNFAGTINLKNNIWITSGNPIYQSGSIGSFNQSNNYTMSPSEASTYGFTRANKYAPTSADSHVTGQATNLASVLGSLQYDAGGAPWFGGSYAQRGSSWDLGAFVVGSKSSGGSPPTKPNPPTALSASVQ